MQFLIIFTLILTIVNAANGEETNSQLRGAVAKGKKTTDVNKNYNDLLNEGQGFRITAFKYMYEYPGLDLPDTFVSLGWTRMEKLAIPGSILAHDITFVMERQSPYSIDRWMNEFFFDPLMFGSVLEKSTRSLEMSFVEHTNVYEVASHSSVDNDEFTFYDLGEEIQKITGRNQFDTGDGTGGVYIYAGYTRWLTQEQAALILKVPTADLDKENFAAEYKNVWDTIHVVPVPVWGQCGGKDYTGVKSCAAGLTCVVKNEYYSQCKPSE